MSCIINGNDSTFKYEADGLRRQKTTNSVTTDYAYDGTMLVREGNGSHAFGGTLTASRVTATYLIGARGPEYRRDDTAQETDSQGHTVTKASWYVFDGLGSVVGEVDPLGNLTSSPKYDVYGAVRGNGGTASSKQGFVGSLGHVSDDTGLVYMRARYMDPNTGRFVSEDPAQVGRNWSSYCEDNPVNRVDRTGQWDEAVFEEAAAIFALACDESPAFRNGEAEVALDRWIGCISESAIEESMDPSGPVSDPIELRKALAHGQLFFSWGESMGNPGGLSIASQAKGEEEGHDAVITLTMLFLDQI